MPSGAGVGEFDLIYRYFAGEAGDALPDSVILGVGDDGAIVQPVEGQQLVVSVDTLVAGVHFPEDADAEEIGQRALRVNLSDLAAMGATPAWFTLALTLPPDWDDNKRRDWVSAFSRGLGDCARQYACTLVGGDTTAGPLTISIQVMGQVPRGMALRRDGASVDDFVLVTHTLGDGAAALASLDRPQADPYLQARFYRPEPRLAEGVLLRGIASAALDVSDGLVADLGHLCRASDVGAVIDVAALPMSDALAAVDEHTRQQWALGGGDDYELVFTVAPDRLSDLASLQAEGQINATVIGRICAGSGVQCELNGQPYALTREGYRHFHE